MPAYKDDLFGIHVIVHATSAGPRSAPAVSETIIDGVIAAFHEGGHPESAEILARRLPGRNEDVVRRLLLDRLPSPLFSGAGFQFDGQLIQLDPADHRCVAGIVEIRPRDSESQHVELSGKVFAVNRRDQAG